MKRQTSGVYFRIRKMSKISLINIIESEYFYVKGSSSNIPITGDNGCVELATALLIWRDVNKYTTTYNKVYGKDAVVLFKDKFAEGLGLAFNYTNDLKWSKHMYNVITTTELINYKTWQKIYSYLRINLLDQLKKFEFYRNWYFVESAHQRNSEFKQGYNKIPSYGMKLNYYKHQGLMLDEHK